MTENHNRIMRWQLNFRAAVEEADIKMVKELWKEVCCNDTQFCKMAAIYQETLLEALASIATSSSSMFELLLTFAHFECICEFHNKVRVTKLHPMAKWILVEKFPHCFCKKNESK